MSYLRDPSLVARTAQVQEEKVREERLFVEYIGPSLNAIMGAKSSTGKPIGVGLYIGCKNEMGTALMAAGIGRIKPFTKPIELWFFPRVKAGKAGKITKAFDCLNFGISYKILEDWLVKCRIIRDDNRDCVFGAHCMRSELAEDGKVGIWMVIREVESAAVLGHQEEIVMPLQPEF